MKRICDCNSGSTGRGRCFLSDRLGSYSRCCACWPAQWWPITVSGMLASKRESLGSSGDPADGWSSARGAKGIIKKVSYLCVIAVAMMVDYVIAVAAGYLDIVMPVTAFSGYWSRFGIC